MPALTIIIPVYNEERSIMECLDTVLAADTTGLSKEVIVIDDGSTDTTRQKIQQRQQETNNSSARFQLITNSKHQGKGAVVKQGLLASAGDIVIIQDADLEYSPRDYPALLEPFKRFDADAVYGSRFISHQPHRVLFYWHLLANKALTTLSNMFTNINLTDMETGYKAFRGDLIRKIAPQLKSRRFGFEPEVTARLAKIKGIKIYEVGISYRGRTYAEGKKIRWTDGLRAIWEIIKYNVLS